MFLGSKYGTGYLKYLKIRPKKACKRSLIGTLLDVLQTEDSNIDVDMVIVRMKSKQINQLCFLILWWWTTAEPRYKEVPRDLQNMFATTKFRYIEVLFHIFYYYWGRQDRSLYRGLRYMEVRYINVPLYLVLSINYSLHWILTTPNANPIFFILPSRAVRLWI